MAEVFGFSGKDVGRIRDVVKDHESRPARRPVAQDGASVVGASRVLIAVPRVAADVNGFYTGDIYAYNANTNDYDLLSTGQLIKLLPETL